MYILLALLAACALGVIVHFVLPHRSLRGVAVTPAVATAVAAAAYTIMQWAGVAESDPVLWMASIGGAVLVAVLATVALSAQRRHHDAAHVRALGI